MAHSVEQYLLMIDFSCHCDIQDPVSRAACLFAGKMSSDLLKIDCEAWKKKGRRDERENENGRTELNSQSESEG